MELGTRRQLLPVRWYPPQPRNAVRGTRIFRDYLFQDESVWTRGQNCQVLKAGFLRCAHQLSFVGTLTLSLGIGGGGDGRVLLTYRFRATPPPPPKASLWEHSLSAQFCASCVGSSFVRLPLECFETPQRLRIPLEFSPAPALGLIPLQPEDCNLAGKEGVDSYSSI